MTGSRAKQVAHEMRHARHQVKGEFASARIVAVESARLSPRWIGMKRRFLWLAAAALALGAAVVLYRGPGRGVIRGHVGDVAATMLVYAVLGLIWRARPAVRAAAALAIAAVVELGQTVWHGDGFVGEMTIGG